MISHGDHLCFAFSILGGLDICCLYTPYGLPWSVWFTLQCPVMSEQGSSRFDVSPRRASGKSVGTPAMSGQGSGRKDASKRSDKTSTVARGSRGKEPVVAVPRVSESFPSTSQLPQTPSESAQVTNEKLDRLTTLLSGFIEKCSADRVAASPDFSGFHDVSSSDELPEADGDSDPMDGLDELLSPSQPLPSACCNQQEDAFQSAFADLAGSFLSEEEKGAPLSEKLVNILNQSLRRRPLDDNVKATAAKVKFPSNVGKLPGACDQW